jgi:hypothetical protein
MTGTGYFVRENTVVFCKENWGDNKKKKENRKKGEKRKKKKRKNEKYLFIYLESTALL